MKMTKTQMIAALAEKTGMSKKDVNDFMSALYAMAMNEVKANGEFILGDFGKLVKADRAARMGRNPQTGEAIQIKAKTVVKFKLSKPTKDALA